MEWMKNTRDSEASRGMEKEAWHVIRSFEVCSGILYEELQQDNQSKGQSQRHPGPCSKWSKILSNYGATMQGRI